MTKKQIKQLAKRIAEYEKIIQDNLNAEAVEEAKTMIMKLSNDLEVEDMLILDEFIAELLEK